MQKERNTDTVNISVLKNGSALNINPSAITDNTITLYTENAGGSGGATGVRIPFSVVFEPVRNGVPGRQYTVQVVSQ